MADEKNMSTDFFIFIGIVRTVVLNVINSDFGPVI